MSRILEYIRSAPTPRAIGSFHGRGHASLIPLEGGRVRSDIGQFVFGVEPLEDCWRLLLRRRYQTPVRLSWLAVPALGLDTYVALPSQSATKPHGRFGLQGGAKMSVTSWPSLCHAQGLLQEGLPRDDAPSASGPGPYPSPASHRPSSPASMQCRRHWFFFL